METEQVVNKRNIMNILEIFYMEREKPILVINWMVFLWFVIIFFL